MRFPKFIQQGDTIGFVAPSFGCAIEPYYSAFQHAQDQLEKKGFSLHLGPNCFKNDGIGISSSPTKCANEFMDMYCSSQNDCLISCGGGELMCEILGELDFKKLAQYEPKWFMGYSDNTNLTFLLTTLADTASIYGPCAASFGMEPWHEGIQDALYLLMGKTNIMHHYPKWEIESIKDELHPLEPYHVTEDYKIVSFPEKEHQYSFEGRLIGGCLDCLNHLAGTKYDHVADFAERYQADGIIWFLEACDLNVMDIRRTLWHLRESGWFQHVKGFLIGRPMHYNEPMMGLDQYHAVTDILQEFSVPILMDLDIGHLAPMMPLISGSYASVKSFKNEFHIKMEMR